MNEELAAQIAMARVYAAGIEGISVRFWNGPHYDNTIGIAMLHGHFKRWIFLPETNRGNLIEQIDQLCANFNIPRRTPA